MAVSLTPWGRLQQAGLRPPQPLTAPSMVYHLLNQCYPSIGGLLCLVLVGLLERWGPLPPEAWWSVRPRSEGADDLLVTEEEDVQEMTPAPHTTNHLFLGSSSVGQIITCLLTRCHF